LGPTAPHIALPFGFRELTTGVDGTVPAADWLQIGGRIEFRHPQADGGALMPLPPPGAGGPTSFVRYGVLAHLHTPSMPPYRATAMLDYSIYQDVAGDPFSFGQFKARLTWTRPLTRDVRTDTTGARSIIDRVFCHAAKVMACDYGTVTIHGDVTLSHTFGHSVVPFYYQPTLGGTDIDGFDTLRGFDDYRFRAPDDWLAQVEYSHRVWGPVGLLLFYDVGKVALGTSQLNFAAVRQDFGAGATLTVVARMVLRAYIAFGSGESTATAVKLAQF
jgi:hypothetical protein